MVNQKMKYQEHYEECRDPSLPARLSQSLTGQMP